MTRAARSILAAMALWACSSAAHAYTANKVWFEFKPAGGYRVYVNYTVPELKEYREAYVDFTSKRDAERYYWDLVRGADFYANDPAQRRFVQQPMEPRPW